LLFDSPQYDSFVATPDNASLAGDGFFNRVDGFALVRATSQGGGDLADLHDGAGNDLFRSTVSYTFLGAANGSYLNLAIGFARVFGSADEGGNDSADLYDTPGNDTFTGPDTEGIPFSTSGSLTTPGYKVYVNRFGTVRATSSLGGVDHLFIGSITYSFSAI